MKQLQIHRLQNAVFEAADFGEALQAADRGVTRIRAGGLGEVVEHGVTVVRPERQTPVGASRLLAADLLLDDRLDQSVHIDHAFEVVGFEEVALAVMLRAAQVYETDPVGARLEHLDDVVVEAAAEAARAEADAVRGAVDHLEQIFHVVDVAENPGQAEDRIRRVVRVDHHDAARFLRDRADFRQEVLQVRFEVGAGQVLVLFEHRAHILKSHAFEARKVVDQPGGELLQLFRGQALIEGFGFGDLFGRVVPFGAGALQDEDLKRGELRLVEVKRLGAVRQPVVQVGADPVQHRHEVVGDHFHAALAEIAQALLVVRDVLLAAAAAGLDILVDRQALDYAPDKTGVLDYLFVFLDLLDAPDFAVGDVVQTADHAGGAGLAHEFQRNRVFRTVPAEGLFHIVSHDSRLPKRRRMRRRPAVPRR